MAGQQHRCGRRTARVGATTLVAVAMLAAAAIAPTAAAAVDCAAPASKGKSVFCPVAPLPASIRARAERFLAEQTDASYAERRYQFDAAGASAEHNGDCNGPVLGYALRYRYAALVEVDAKPVEVFLRVPKDPACGSGGDVVVKDRSGAIVEPKISHSRAVDIARAHVGAGTPQREAAATFLSPLGGNPGEGWQWRIELSDPPIQAPDHGACWPVKTVTIDAVSGVVVAVREAEACT